MQAQIQKTARPSEGSDSALAAAQPRPAAFVLRTEIVTKSTAFYRGLLGWTLVDADTFSDRQGVPVAALESGAGGWVPYLSVADLDAALARARQFGATAVGPKTYRRRAHQVLISGPGGAQFGLSQLDDAAAAHAMRDVARVRWIEEKTHHQAAETTFLGDLFGFEIVGVEGPGGVRVLKGSPPLFGGVMQFDHRWEPDAAPHWLVYIEVEDVAATSELAVTLGGTVWFPSFDTPLGRMAYLRDSNGAAFAVVELSDQGRAMTGDSE